MDVEELEARVAWIEDRAAIDDLVVRYAVATDDRDVDALRDMYAEDAVFDSTQGRFEGREAVLDFYDRRLAHLGPSYHIPYANSIDRISPTEARGTVLAAAELAIDGGTFMVALRYADHYVKGGDGRWRFRERVIQQFYAMPFSELADGLASARRKRWPGTDPATADIPEGLETWARHRARHGV